MKPFFALLLSLVILGAGCSKNQNPPPSTAPPGSATGVTSPAPVETYGMSEYSDPEYGFSFWYPGNLQITASKTLDEVSFPGGVAVKKLDVGPAGGTSLVVVNSPTGSITDEPANHASPIGQTKYFYDSATERWMIAFPQDADNGSRYATTTADISQKTMGGLFMLHTGRRFNTTIVPLGTTRFLVISDGGGSMFTPHLAKTIMPTGASVAASVKTDALKEEAAAYANQ